MCLCVCVVYRTSPPLCRHQPPLLPKWWVLDVGWNAHHIHEYANFKTTATKCSLLLWRRQMPCNASFLMELLPYVPEMNHCNYDWIKKQQDAKRKQQKAQKLPHNVKKSESKKESISEVATTKNAPKRIEKSLVLPCHIYKCITIYDFTPPLKCSYQQQATTSNTSLLRFGHYSFATLRGLLYSSHPRAWVVLLPNPNHVEERLLDQAWARAPYTPLFGGCTRSIPQCMVSNV